MTNQTRIIRLPELIKMIGLSKATIYLMMKKGSLPSSIALSENSVGWIESEINEWIASRIAKRDEVA